MSEPEKCYEYTWKHSTTLSARALLSCAVQCTDACDTKSIIHVSQFRADGVYARARALSSASSTSTKFMHKSHPKRKRITTGSKQQHGREWKQTWKWYERNEIIAFMFSFQTLSHYLLSLLPGLATALSLVCVRVRCGRSRVRQRAVIFACASRLLSGNGGHGWCSQFAMAAWRSHSFSYRMCECDGKNIFFYSTTTYNVRTGDQLAFSWQRAGSSRKGTPFDCRQQRRTDGNDIEQYVARLPYANCGHADMLWCVCVCVGLAYIAYLADKVGRKKNPDRRLQVIFVVCVVNWNRAAADQHISWFTSLGNFRRSNCMRINCKCLMNL